MLDNRDTGDSPPDFSKSQDLPAAFKSFESEFTQFSEDDTYTSSELLENVEHWISTTKEQNTLISSEQTGERPDGAPLAAERRDSPRGGSTGQAPPSPAPRAPSSDPKNPRKWRKTPATLVAFFERGRVGSSLSRPAFSKVERATVALLLFLLAFLAIEVARVRPINP